jgi:signal transduction histidine kinase
MESMIYIGILLILAICLGGGLFAFFHALKQKQALHQTILRSQNEKEIETYSHIAGEYLHQQVINGRILPHLIQLKELNYLVDVSKNPKNQAIAEKIQEMMRELKQTENIVRNISEHIFPPHLMYFFVETCQKRIDELQQMYPTATKVVFLHEGTFSDLMQQHTLLYNIYSLIDLFVTNSLQSAQAAQVKVVLIREKTQLTLVMHDNGIGFNMPNMARNASGRGLADFKGRAMVLSPNYLFESEEGKGTQFKIVVNLQNT